MHLPLESHLKAFCGSIYDKALIQFGLIGDKSSKGAYKEVNQHHHKNSVKIGFREINIGSTHMFCTDNIKNPLEMR